MRHEPRSTADGVIECADLLGDDGVAPTPKAGLPHAAVGPAWDSRKWVRMRDPILALAVGSLALAASAAFESALSPAHRSGRLATWTSEIALACALAAATYLCLRARHLRGTLTTIERSRIETAKEARLATAIQRHLLKTPLTYPSAVSWHARLRTGRRMGGDFYDVVTQSQGSVLILSAHISSHGISAAVTIASVLSAFRQIARRTPDPSTLASALSQAIHDDHAGSTYVTAILCLVDPAKGALRYINAGHPPGRLAGPGGLVRLETTGPALGLRANGRWETHTLVSRAYTLGLLVTDGVADALATEGDADEILDALARRLAGETPEAACSSVMQRLRRAAQSPSAPPDDGTVLTFAPTRRRA